jgi:glycosyltransferase involved in cell wall biosynthesis
MVKAFQNAKGFIFAGLDDFGITPVEAMAAGTPVIAFKAGGALDYVVDGQTGTFFSEQTVQSLVDALEKFETLTFSEETVVNKAVQFNPENFKVNIRNFVNDELAKLQK